MTICTSLVCTAKNTCPEASSSGTVLPVKSHALRGVTKPQKPPTALLHNTIMESSALRPTECTRSTSHRLICTAESQKYAHKHAEAWEISRPAFQMTSFFGAIPFYFGSACFIFSQHSWLSLCISVHTSWCFSERVDRNLLRIVIRGRVS